MSQKHVFSVYLAIALLLGLAPAFAGETLKVGVCMSLTGDFADFGKQYAGGVSLRLKEYEANRGPEDPVVELIFRDDESKADVAAAHTRELLEKENVSVIIGSVSSGITLAMREITNPLGVALVTPSATSPELGIDGDGVFRVLFDDSFQGEALAKYVFHKLGLTSAAIVTNKRFPYSRSISDAFQKHFTAEGGDVIVYSFDHALVDAEGVDFRPMLKGLQSYNPDVMVITSYSEDATSILQQAQGTDVKIRFCGGDAWHHENTLLAAGNYIVGAFYVGVINESQPTPRVREFIKLLDTSNLDINETAGQGFDAMSLVLEAAKNGASRREIVDGLYAIKDFELVTGNISFDREEGTKKPAFILEIVEDGNQFSRKVVDIVEP